jgi:hypothetical protein
MDDRGSPGGREAELEGALARAGTAQRLLEALVGEAVPGDFLLVDAEGRVAFASVGARRLFADPLPEDATVLLRSVDSRLDVDLWTALAGTAGAPRAVSVQGRDLLVSAAPLCLAGEVEGAVIRIFPCAEARR